MSIFLISIQNLNYTKFRGLPIRIPIGIILELQKLFLNFTGKQNTEELPRNFEIRRLMKKAWPITNIKIQDKATAIKSVCCWQRNTKMQGKKDESKKKKFQMYTGISYITKVPFQINGGREEYSTNDFGIIKLEIRLYLQLSVSKLNS